MPYEGQNQQYNHYYNGQPYYNAQYAQYGDSAQSFSSHLQQQAVQQDPQIQVVIPSRQAQPPYSHQQPQAYFPPQSQYGPSQTIQQYHATSQPQHQFQPQYAMHPQSPIRSHPQPQPPQQVLQPQSIGWPLDQNYQPLNAQQIDYMNAFQAQSSTGPQAYRQFQSSPQPQSSLQPQYSNSLRDASMSTPQHPHPKHKLNTTKPATPQTQQPLRILQDVKPNAPRIQPSIKPESPAEFIKEEPEPDYAILLLTLADEYFDQARNLGIRNEQYCKLIATSLGCIEALLNNFKVPALREAQLSLRYAQLLHDETENYDDAERILTKAIDVCERNKFVDIKYAAHLLLNRVLYRSKPKAAIKDLQALVEDTETYKHIAWEYALRFQSAMFYLSNPAVRDIHAAITQLDKLGTSARRNTDHAVLAFAATIEALLHLQSSGSDAVVSAQRALAKARALQLDSNVEGNPQIIFTMEVVDLCCSFRESDITQMEVKRKHLQQSLYDMIEHKNWTETGTMQLRISKASLAGQQLQNGGLVLEREGRYYLLFSWLEKRDAESIGLLLAAVSTVHQSSSDTGKAATFIAQGLEIVRSPPVFSSISMSSVEGATHWRKVMECRFLIETAFMKCSKGQWQHAQDTIDIITKAMDELDGPRAKVMIHIHQYLTGVIQQGKGNTDAALQIYLSPQFNLARFRSGGAASSSTTNTSSQKSHDMNHDTTRDISLLANMNAILIIASPQHPQHSQTATLLTHLADLVPTSHNKLIYASYSLLLSIVNSDSLLKSKKYLGEALHAAQAISNAQITALTLSLMQETLFKGQVGEQAIKCAKAASAQVRKWGEPTWIHVTSGMEADCYDVQGMKEEAERKRVEAATRLEDVPVGIREAMSGRRY